jgi:hypothetical protein
MSTDTARLPLEIHVGGHPPSHWSQLEERARSRGVAPIGAMAALNDGRRWGRPPLSEAAFPWKELGVMPRYVGEESTSCIAAFEPKLLSEGGATEFERFVSAAATRGETALIVSTIGAPERTSLRNVFGIDAYIPLPDFEGTIGGRRLSAGASAQAADGLVGADRDLALRLRNRPNDAPLWSLTLNPAVLEDSDGITEHRPKGRLDPLLVNDIGEIVAAVWVPEGKDWRWYIVPAETPWKWITSWVVERAVPEYVPGALRRTHAAELVDEALLTSEELRARNALSDFEAATAREREQLGLLVEAARARVDEVRSGLLYGSGRPLVLAVKAVLESAGFDVVDLDTRLAGTESADLLVSRADKHHLVEVKSSARKPNEDPLNDLTKHVRTWPALGQRETIEGGVLVMSHQLNAPPLERASLPYSRDAFIRSLPYPIVPVLALFGWWRDGDCRAIVDAVTGPARCYAVDLTTRTVPAGESSQPTGSASSPSRPTSRRPGRRGRVWRR